MGIRDVEERFNDPRRFSFKDGLACAFAGTYLTQIWLIFLGYGDKYIIDALNPLLVVILSGYFVHEVARMGTDAYSQRQNSQYGGNYENNRSGPPI